MARKAKDKDAEFQARPDMQALDAFTRQLLTVSKEDLARAEAREKEAKGSQQGK